MIRRVQEQARFALHISVHPFDGFWDMKREGRGRLSAALILTALMLLTHVWAQQAQAFLFNTEKFAPYDMLFEITKLTLLIAVFCVANWSVTTLLQGEGTFRDIVMVTGYACVPLILIPLPAALLRLRRSQRYSALRLLPATVRLHMFTATAAATQRTRQTTRVCRTATLQCV